MRNGKACRGFLLLFLISMGSAALAMLHWTRDYPVPIELPSPAIEGFNSIQNSVRADRWYPPTAFGVVVVDSGLLSSSFPDHTFVRVTTAVDRRWMFVSPFPVSYSGQYTHVHVIPHTGEPPYKIGEEADLNRIMANGNVFIHNKSDADLVRQLILELNPQIKGLSSVNEFTGNQKWHVAVQDFGTSSCYWEVKTGLDGRFVNIQSETVSDVKQETNSSK